MFESVPGVCWRRWHASKEGAQVSTVLVERHFGAFRVEAFSNHENRNLHSALGLLELFRCSFCRAARQILKNAIGALTQFFIIRNQVDHVTTNCVSKPQRHQCRDHVESSFLGTCRTETCRARDDFRRCFQEDRKIRLTEEGSVRIVCQCNGFRACRLCASERAKSIRS